MRLESQLSRMNCQTFSTGLSSGHFGGSTMMVILAGTRRRVDKCQPAWSTRRMAWAAGATVAAISARCKFIASVLQAGMIRAAPLPLQAHLAAVNAQAKQHPPDTTLDVRTASAYVRKQVGNFFRES